MAEKTSSGTNLVETKTNMKEKAVLRPESNLKETSGGEKEFKSAEDAQQLWDELIEINLKFMKKQGFSEEKQQSMLEEVVPIMNKMVVLLMESNESEPEEIKKFKDQVEISPEDLKKFAEAVVRIQKEAMESLTKRNLEHHSCLPRHRKNLTD
jgi:hypothetical protein